MAKQNLAELIEWLGRNKLHHIEVYNIDTEKVIDNCLSYQDLIDKYGSPTGYFEALANKGIQNVQLVTKIKNGTSWRDRSCGKNFAISKKNVAASGAQAAPGATPQQQNTGLGSPASYGGLGMPEIMAMRSQADRYEDLKLELQKRDQEKAEFLQKIATLEAENKTLERENLKHELGKESKPSAVDKLVEGFANNPEALGALISSFKGSGQPALNAPQTPQNLSDAKTMVIDHLTSPHLNDNHAMAAYHILDQALAGNEAFTGAYIKLLQEHKIIPNGSERNSNG